MRISQLGGPRAAQGVDAIENPRRRECGKLHVPVCAPRIKTEQLTGTPESRMHDQLARTFHAIEQATQGLGVEPTPQQISSKKLIGRLQGLISAKHPGSAKRKALQRQSAEARACASSPPRPRDAHAGDSVVASQLTGEFEDARELVQVLVPVEMAGAKSPGNGRLYLRAEFTFNVTESDPLRDPGRCESTQAPTEASTSKKARSLSPKKRRPDLHEG